MKARKKKVSKKVPILTVVSEWSQKVLDIQDLDPDEVKIELDLLHEEMEVVYNALSQKEVSRG